MLAPLVFAALLAAAPDTARSLSAPPPTLRHSLATPAQAGMHSLALTRAELAIAAGLQRQTFPGAALAVGRWGHVVVERGVGKVGWGAWDDLVHPEETLYDLASLTKVMALTTAVMLLVEDGKMELDGYVHWYLPAFWGEGKERVTVRQMLSHTSGLPAGGNVWGYTPTDAFGRALAVRLKHPPGTAVEYSDIGPIILWEAAERAAGEPLYGLLERRVFAPLGMASTTFLPGEACRRCAPSERRRDGTVIQGRVHDPIANRLGGIAGNAGLFSTAHDVARFAAMMANAGELEGVRVLRPETIRAFTRRQPGAGTRALGWDTPARDGTGSGGLGMSPTAFGHTGFTGTSVWIDPERGTWVVLLSNRTFEPRGGNRIQALRREVHDLVAGSVVPGGGAAVAR
jgi:serine-type D-Ala-D-Ala carboxypeptidase